MSIFKRCSAKSQIFFCRYRQKVPIFLQQLLFHSDTFYEVSLSSYADYVSTKTINLKVFRDVYKIPARQGGQVGAVRKAQNM